MFLNLILRFQYDINIIYNSVYKNSELQKLQTISKISKIF